MCVSKHEAQIMEPVMLITNDGPIMDPWGKPKVALDLNPLQLNWVC